MSADPFAIHEGGPSGPGTIIEAGFMVHDDFTDRATGDPMCVLRVTIDMDDYDEPWDKLYPCGAGWEPTDDGRSARREDDPDNTKVNFNGGTKAGRFVKKIVAVAPDVIKQRYAEGEGPGATDAALIEGLRFEFDNVERKYRFKDRETGEMIEGETSDFLPVTFLGEAEGGEKPAATKPKAAKKAPAKKAPAKKATKAKAKPEPEPEPEGIPAALRGELRKVFDAADDFDTFVEQAVELDGTEDHLDFICAEDDGLWDEFVDEDEG